MSRNSKFVALICGGVSVIATIIFYLLVFDNIFTVPMRWISFLCLVMAEVIGTIKVFKIKQNILGETVIFTSLIQLLLVLIISIIFVNAFPFAIKTYILLNLLILCIMAVADSIILHMTGHVQAENNRLEQCKNVMDACYMKAQTLKSEYADCKYEKELADIIEMLKYSDNSALTGDESIILSKLEDLQMVLPNNDDEVLKRIVEIKNLIQLRSVKLGSQKRGSY